jgi:hypothetical protein
MEIQTQDYSDLMGATDDYIKCCNKLLAKKQDVLDKMLLFKEKENNVKVKHFHDLIAGSITQSKFDKQVEFDTYKEKIAWETAKAEKSMIETEQSALEEKLRTTKILNKPDHVYQPPQIRQA